MVKKKFFYVFKKKNLRIWIKNGEKKNVSPLYYFFSIIA